MTLSLAASIDAPAVGLSLAMSGVSVRPPALGMGTVAETFTTAGIHMGG